MNTGELVLVVGPVGSGKSSLLSAVMGNLKERSGSGSGSSSGGSSGSGSGSGSSSGSSSSSGGGGGSSNNTSVKGSGNSDTTANGTATTGGSVGCSSSDSVGAVTTVRVTSSIAYAAQAPWIFAGSVRSNVLIAGKCSAVVVCVSVL